LTENLCSCHIKIVIKVVFPKKKRLEPLAWNKGVKWMTINHTGVGPLVETKIYSPTVETKPFVSTNGPMMVN
jgi:hypothetical protein